MGSYEYKALIYAIEGKYTHSLRYWCELSGSKAYGEKQRARLIGAIPSQMKQLEQAMTELDQEGWELVSHSTSMIFPWVPQGTAIVRRRLSKEQ